jgi:hypothetical protein
METKSSNCLSRFIIAMLVVVIVTIIHRDFFIGLLRDMLVSSSAELHGLETSNYFLPVVLKDRSSCQETEPNDLYSTASGPVLPETPCFGYFPTSTDTSDYFFFVLPATSKVEIMLINIPFGSDYNLTLRDANLDPIRQSGNPGNSNEEIQINLLPAARYYIQISNFGQTNSFQPYELKAQYELPITPTPTNTPIPTPSTPTPTSEPEPPLPPSYSMFDDFIGTGPLSEDKWDVANEPQGSCNGTQLDGSLQTQCEAVNEDAHIRYELKLDNFHVAKAGAAIAAAVTTPDDNGHVQLQLVLSNEGGTENIRRYALTLYYNELAVVEHYPLDDTEENLVTIEPFDGTQIHILRMEYQPQSRSISFYVDGVKIILDVQPDIPIDSRARYWEILAYLHQTNEPITWKSKVYWSSFLSE